MEMEETSFLGDDTDGFFLQVGLLEGIIKDGQIFNTLSEAYYHIFRNSKEFAMILWNGLPVRLSYTRDLPLLVEPLTNFLINLSQDNDSPRHQKVILKTKSFNTQWQVQWDESWVEIQAQWEEIKGNYQDALNASGHIRMPKVAFLAEWRLLLEQLVKSFMDTGTELRDSEQKGYIEQLDELIKLIPQRGRFYHRANN